MLEVIVDVWLSGVDQQVVLNWLMTMQLFYVRKEDKQGSLHLHPTHTKIVEVKSPIKGKVRHPSSPPPHPQKEKTRHSFQKCRGV